MSDRGWDGPSGPGNSYTNIRNDGEARVQLGNTYNISREDPLSLLPFATHAPFNSYDRQHEPKGSILQHLMPSTPKQCQIVAEMSADRLPRSIQLQLSRELGDLEERRSKATAELRRATKSAGSEGAAMKQDLEQSGVKEKKVTERIERSR